MTIINPFLIGSGSITQPQDFYIQTYVVTFGPLPPGMQVYDPAPAWNLPRATLPGQPAITWTQSLIISTLYVPPDNTKLLRPIWRSLPDQPVTPLPQTWAWKYNQNLIGKDLVPGRQTYDLVPSQRPPEQVQLHSWNWNYNLNLIGQDRLPVRQQDWPLPIPPALVKDWIQSVNLLLQAVPIPFSQTYWPITLPALQIDRTIAASYNLNLIGQDKLPTGQQVYDLVPRISPAAILTWIQSTSIALISMPVDNTKLFRPPLRSLPDQPPQPIQQTFQPVNIALTGVIPPKPFAQYSWPLTLAPQPIDQTVGASYNKNLVGQDRLPNRQQDWPLTPAPKPIEQTIAASYNDNLIGQDKLPFRQTDWPNPIPPPLVKDWIVAVNLALTTAPPNLYAQARQQDWPVPRGAEPDWRRSWEWSYNRNLIAQDQLPFRQTDWPNPVTPVLVKDWIQSTNIALLAIQKPFAQYDWPLAPAVAQPDRTISASYLKTLIGQDRLPTGKNIFDLAPRGPQPIEQTQAASYLKTLIGQDQLPNRQTDWPLSPGHITQLLQITALGTATIRFPVIPLPPGAILYSRPELGPSPLLQQSVYEYNVAFIPPPTGVTLILRTLMGTGA